MLISELQNPQNDHLGWVDLLRVVACFLVVISHCCDSFVAQFDADRATFLTGTWVGSFVRASVPLFVMMSGVLLLPLRVSMAEFYRRRVGRILPPLIFWSIALPLLWLVYLQLAPATHNPLIAQDGYTAATAWNKIYTFIFNFNFDTTPLWYLYMLLGLYLILPMLSAWLERASQREERLLLLIWGASLLLPYVKLLAPVLGYTGNFGNMGILGICDWNSYGTFYYVSGFIGYLLLAHYLVRYPLTWSWPKTLCITIPMFAIGYLITALGFILTQRYSPGNYANLEIVWLFTGINVFMMTFAIFVLVQRLRISPSVWLSRLASATFGIYLCHFVLVQVAYDLFQAYCPLPTLPRILGMAIVVFCVGYLLVRVMNNFAITRRFVR